MIFIVENEFCEQMKELCNNDISSLKRRLFSDETFTLHGHVNKENCYYEVTNIQKLDVRCGMIEGKILSLISRGLSPVQDIGIGISHNCDLLKTDIYC